MTTTRANMTDIENAEAKLKRIVQREGERPAGYLEILIKEQAAERMAAERINNGKY